MENTNSITSFEKKISKLSSDSGDENIFIESIIKVNKNVQIFNHFIINLTFLYKKIIKEKIESLNLKFTNSSKEMKNKLEMILKSLRQNRTDLNLKQSDYFKAAENFAILKRENRNSKNEKIKQLKKAQKNLKSITEKDYCLDYVI